jgi:hypothetical protein
VVVIATQTLIEGLGQRHGPPLAQCCSGQKISLIPEVRAPLDRIIDNGLFISTRLRNECLRLAGE